MCTEIKLITLTKIRMANFIRHKTSESGRHYFDGQMVLTDSVSSLLSEEEVECIVTNVQKEARGQGGLHFIQIYECEEDGRLVWIVNQLTVQERNKTQTYPKEEDYFTILLPGETA